MAKKEFVNRMFDDIAPTYDRLNHLLSMDVDKAWRRKAVRAIMAGHPSQVADLACGTADFSIALARAGVEEVIGYDISEGMLKVGREKVDNLGLANHIRLENGDSECLPLADGSVDAVTVAFGIRNFEHKDIGLREMHRILRPRGRVCILELSVPQCRLIRELYKLYFLHILPFFGGLVSGNREAYRYLPVSVINFPPPAEFMEMMKKAGFHNVETRSFTFGLCRMYLGEV